MALTWTVFSLSPQSWLRCVRRQLLVAKHSSLTSLCVCMLAQTVILDYYEREVRPQHQQHGNGL